MRVIKIKKSDKYQRNLDGDFRSCIKSVQEDVGYELSSSIKKMEWYISNYAGQEGFAPSIKQLEGYIKKLERMQAIAESIR